ncbi:MAG TPA: response regulator [Tepidisphaeraceae bacterium]|jgi:DNA-binding NtrC family response regulator|nr:response regulator [Tepidisphaeraceae bacterium]
MVPAPIRVLVVDDDIAVLRSLTAFLEDENFDVLSTNSAKEALNILAIETIDLAVVDVRLREMDGEELILRAHAGRPTTKYVVYTGSLNYQAPASLAIAGVTQANVVYKPARSLSAMADDIRRIAGGT